MDIPLMDRKYTWSNEQSPPTLVRLDRALCNLGWNLCFASYQLIPLASSMSDHCPLLLCPSDAPKRSRLFRFEQHWTLLEGFQEQVLASWNRPVRSNHPAIALNFKLRRLARDLRAWCVRNLGDVALQMELALNFIANLDLAMDHRGLSPAESALRKDLKLRVLGLGAIDRVRWRQRSRICWLKAGDVNTRYFHRRKNFIRILHTPRGLCTSPEDKAAALRDHFVSVLGTPSAFTVSLDWDRLALPCLDLPVTLEEVQRAVNALPTDKAPGPDGHRQSFNPRGHPKLLSCWGLLFRLSQHGFHHSAAQKRLSVHNQRFSPH